MRTRNRLLAVTAAVAGLVLVVVISHVDRGRIDPHLVVTRPMPCASDEVYVWTDYPDEAGCVSSTDHAAHAGHQG